MGSKRRGWGNRGDRPVTPVKPDGKAIPTDVPGTLPGPSTATEALDRLEDAKKLPPFLHEQIRHREAYLTLIKDLTEHLGDKDWQGTAMVEVKEKFNRIIARSLEMWI